MSEGTGKKSKSRSFGIPLKTRTSKEKRCNMHDPHNFECTTITRKLMKAVISSAVAAALASTEEKKNAQNLGNWVILLWIVRTYATYISLYYYRCALHLWLSATEKNKQEQLANEQAEQRRVEENRQHADMVQNAWVCFGLLLALSLSLSRFILLYEIIIQICCSLFHSLHIIRLRCDLLQCCWCGAQHSFIVRCIYHIIVNSNVPLLSRLWN